MKRLVDTGKEWREQRQGKVSRRLVTYFAAFTNSSVTNLL